MTLPINIKVRVLPRFPANVVGRTGIAVSKVNGVYYFDLNYPSVPIAPTVPTGTVPYTLMWDSVSGTYTLIPLSSFTYVEAPNDGFTYGRQSLAWSKALNLAGGTLTGNLILNADPSAALGAATKQYVDSHTSGIPSDAPSDGTIYGRRNGAWTSVLSGGAAVTISDTAPGSPMSGNLWWNSALGEMYIYYNDGSSSQWVAITTAQALGSGGGGGGGAGSFTTNIIGGGTYIVPSGKTTVVGEAWGGGGGGQGNSGAGGGGGGYSKFTATVTPGQTIYYTVGTGGTGVNGGGAFSGANSWVNPSANAQPTTTGCVGGFGGGGGGSPGGGGTGTIGTINFQGGNGGNLAASGGGGGAGSAGNGVTPTTTSGGAGGTPDGGSGGSGGASPVFGSIPGGGGGGCTANVNGGTGGNGQVRLTFS
jgi:hypothetical protein